MTKQTIISQLVSNYKKSLNPNSKWYNQDLVDYKNGISKESITELKRRLGNSNAFYNEGSLFNKQIKNELKKMDKAGMFEIGSMKPQNCLD